jgi:lipopolysaccharide cholinephosphotransferase
MSLAEIQSVGLDIMKEIHVFCMENGIEYSLAYGSMIGAVRHKGFIPWDDDIDIWMTRPNFEKFSSSFKSRNGYQLMSVYDKDNYCNYTRVYEVDKTLVKSPCKACSQEVGVWVDVFPIDGINDDIKQFYSDYDLISKIGRKILGARYDLKKKDEGNLSEIIKSVVKIVIRRMMYGSIENMHNKMIELSKRYEFGKTNYCSSLMCVSAIKKNKPEVFLTDDFKSYELLPFETEMFFVSDAYDHILTTIFGDYMQLPPEKERVAHAQKKWRYYWKQ